MEFLLVGVVALDLSAGYISTCFLQERLNYKPAAIFENLKDNPNILQKIK